MLSYIDYFRSKLTKNLNTTDDKLSLPRKDVEKLLKLKEGDHVYLTLHYLDRHEVVKFTRSGDIKGTEVHVERDINGEGRKNFACGACVTVDWNSIQLAEFICQNKCKG